MLEVLQSTPAPRVVCTFSGGKDSLVSTVMTLELLNKVEFDAYVCYVNTTNEFPVTVDYVHKMFDWFEKRYPVKCYEVKPKVTFEQIADKVFEQFAVMVKQGKWDKESLICAQVLKVEPMMRFVKDFRCNIMVEGVRGEESWIRYMSIMNHGPVTGCGVEGCKKVKPIWNWSAEEVMDFIQKRKLPVNPIYSMGQKGTGCMLCPVQFFVGGPGILRAVPKEQLERYRKLLKKHLGVSRIDEYFRHDPVLEFIKQRRPTRDELIGEFGDEAVDYANLLIRKHLVVRVFDLFRNDVVYTVVS